MFFYFIYEVSKINKKSLMILFFSIFPLFPVDFVLLHMNLRSSKGEFVIYCSFFTNKNSKFILFLKFEERKNLLKCGHSDAKRLLSTKRILSSLMRKTNDRISKSFAQWQGLLRADWPVLG